MYTCVKWSCIHFICCVSSLFVGYKPFKCTMCYKEFLTGYLLKKHMEVHVSERRYKCGQCGKLYKSIGHVREHMRAHSDERPYQCNRCNKGYKTKVKIWTFICKLKLKTFHCSC